MCPVGPVRMTSRRSFVSILGLAVLAVHRHGHAQPSAQAPRVGYLGRSPANQLAFVDGLRALGYVIGKTVLIDARTPKQNTSEEYSVLASQIVVPGVAVILAANPQALEAITKATKTIPIVGVDLESDPAAKGWVASLARPGGNVTGFFLDIPEMSGKQLEFLKEVKPTLARVAVLGDPTVNELQFRAAEGAARSRGLTLQPLLIKSPSEIPEAIAEAARYRAGALLVLTSPLLFSSLTAIADAAVKHRLPTINLFVPFFAEAGGLLAYGPDFHDLFRSAAGYVDRILKGVKPADLPVQRPTRFEFIVNLKTAKALSLQIPQSLLLRADRVIT
jgi:putative tryptophan/tyrosine transport system substrate-binding protein